MMFKGVLLTLKKRGYSIQEDDSKYSFQMRIRYDNEDYDYLVDEVGKIVKENHYEVFHHSSF